MAAKIRWDLGAEFQSHLLLHFQKSNKGGKNAGGKKNKKKKGGSNQRKDAIPGESPKGRDEVRRPGMGEGNEYQTWNQFDQNIFEKDGGPPPAPMADMPAAPPIPMGAASVEDKPARSGIGQGRDYQVRYPSSLANFKAI